MNILSTLTVLAVILVPLAAVIKVQGTDVWYCHYVALFAMMVAGISAWLWRSNKAISSLIILSLLSFVFVTRFNSRSFLCLTQIILACISVYGISLFNAKQRNKIKWAIIFLVFIQAIWVILQYLNLDPIFSKICQGDGSRFVNNSVDDPVGFSGSANTIGIFFAITMPFVLARFPYLLPFSLFGLYCSKTSFAVLASFAGTVILYSRKNVNKLILLILLLTGIGYGYLVNVEKTPTISAITEYLRGRTDPAKDVIRILNTGNITIQRDNVSKIISCNPILGFGVGTFPQIFPWYVPESRFYNQRMDKYAHLHNDFIEFYFEFGWLGGFWLLFLLVKIAKDFWSMRKNKEALVYISSITAYIVCALGTFPTHTAVAGMLLIVIYGMFEGVRRENGKIA